MLDDFHSANKIQFGPHYSYCLFHRVLTDSNPNQKESADCSEVLGLWLVQFWLQRRDVRPRLFCPLLMHHSAIGYSMPFRSIWLAAISMTLMMKAIAKAQIRLFLTHVWRFFFLGWTERINTKRIGKKLHPAGHPLVLQQQIVTKIIYFLILSRINFPPDVPLEIVRLLGGNIYQEQINPLGGTNHLILTFIDPTLKILVLIADLLE